MCIRDRVGSRITLPGHDVDNRGIGLAQGKVLVVYAGACTSCSLNAVDPTVLPFKAFDQIVLVFSATPQEVPKALRSVNDKLRLIADPHLDLTTSLNALWVGRWYEYIDGTLMRMQRSADEKYIGRAS